MGKVRIADPKEMLRAAVALGSYDGVNCALNVIDPADRKDAINMKFRVEVGEVNLLTYALHFGKSVSIARRMFRDYPRDTILCSDGTYLHSAVESGDLDMVRAVVEWHGGVGEMEKLRNTDSQTPLDIAYSYDDGAMVTYLQAQSVVRVPCLRVVSNAISIGNLSALHVLGAFAKEVIDFEFPELHVSFPMVSGGARSAVLTRLHVEHVAAYLGDVQTLKLLKTWGCPFSATTVIRDEPAGHGGLLPFSATDDAAITAFDVATLSGRLHVVQELTSILWSPVGDTFTGAQLGLVEHVAELGHKDIVEYVVERGCPFSDKLFRWVATHMDIDNDTDGGLSLYILMLTVSRNRHAPLPASPTPAEQTLIDFDAASTGPTLGVTMRKFQLMSRAHARNKSRLGRRGQALALLAVGMNATPASPAGEGNMDMGFFALVISQMLSDETN
jgi:hypothetical protein